MQSPHHDKQLFALRNDPKCDHSPQVQSLYKSNNFMRQIFQSLSSLVSTLMYAHSVLRNSSSRLRIFPNTPNTPIATEDCFTKGLSLMMKFSLIVSLKNKPASLPGFPSSCRPRFHSTYLMEVTNQCAFALLFSRLINKPA